MPYRSDMIQKLKIFFVTRSACAHFCVCKCPSRSFALVLDFLPLANIQESTAVKIVLLTFAFVIILIYCVISLWKIEYGGEGFTYRNYFGRKRAYKFNQVEILKIGNAFYFTKNGKKVVRIERIVTNADYLQSAYFNANFNAKKLKI